MAATVEDDGDAIVVVAGTLTEASKLNLSELDVAILDVNIGAQSLANCLTLEFRLLLLRALNSRQLLTI